MLVKGGGTAALGRFTVLDLHKYINSDEKKERHTQNTSMHCYITIYVSDTIGEGGGGGKGVYKPTRFK